MHGLFRRHSRHLTPYGGSGLPFFTPPTLPGTLAALMADTGVTTSGGNVSAITDQASGPSWTVNGTVPLSGTINGRPAFNFGGAGSFKTGASAVALGTGTHAWVCLVGTLNSGAGAFAGLTAYLDSSAGAVDFSTSTSASLVERANTGQEIESTRSSSNLVNSQSAITYDVPFSLVLVFDPNVDMPGGSAVGMQMVIDGTLTQGNFFSTAFGATGMLILGARSSDGAGGITSPWTGLCAECWWGNGTFANANLTAWQTYARAKYGTP